MNPRRDLLMRFIELLAYLVVAAALGLCACWSTFWVYGIDVFAVPGK